MGILSTPQVRRTLRARSRMTARMNSPRLDELNALPAAEFVRQWGDVFEHSPWVAERCAAQRPFHSVQAMHAAMCAVMQAATESEKLTLIRAHPQLAGKAALRGELTVDSTREQQGAGLDQCSEAEFAELHQLNRAYEARFGFPFILAVKGHNRQSILGAWRARLDNTPTQEFSEALRQIERIALFRLQSRLID